MIHTLHSCAKAEDSAMEKLKYGYIEVSWSDGLQKPRISTRVTRVRRVGNVTPDYHHFKRQELNLVHTPT